MPKKRHTTRLNVTPELAMGRRDFLKASAVGAAGLAIVQSIRSHAEDTGPVDSASPSAAPVNPDEAGAWMDEQFRKKPPFDDPSFEDTADKKCPNQYPSKLPEPENSCEVVLDLLWTRFAAGAVGHAVDIQWQAIDVGRRNIRGDILADVTAAGCAPGGPDCNLANFPFGKYFEKWVTLGQKAALKADPNGSGEGIISANHFSEAWAEVYEDHEAPEAKIPPADEATELIGDHLWFRFTLGVMSVVDRSFGEDVIREGRGHSRFYINSNVFKRKVTDGNAAPDYTKWDFGPVGECAYRAGGHASRKAGDDNNSPKILPKHFKKAWCQTSESVKRYARLKGKDYSGMAQGCG